MAENVPVVHDHLFRHARLRIDFDSTIGKFTVGVLFHSLSHTLFRIPTVELVLRMRIVSEPHTAVENASVRATGGKMATRCATVVF